jgi:hypothetical protein
MDRWPEKQRIMKTESILAALGLARSAASLQQPLIGPKGFAPSRTQDLQTDLMAVGIPL